MLWLIESKVFLNCLSSFFFAKYHKLTTIVKCDVINLDRQISDKAKPPVRRGQKAWGLIRTRKMAELPKEKGIGRSAFFVHI